MEYRFQKGKGNMCNMHIKAQEAIKYMYNIT